jgi:hypothetical protein
MTKGAAYYADKSCDWRIQHACFDQLMRVGPEAVAAIFLSPTQDLLDTVRSTRRIAVGGVYGERGYLSMFRQILTGLEMLDTDVAFLCEHDVLYDASHFEFTPPREDVFYYNQNVWQVRASDGHALHYPCSKTSGLCASRELLIEHYRKRVARVEVHGFTRAMGFEPGTHRRPERVDDYGCESWMSAVPNIDIRHDANLTESRWRKDQFRNQKYTDGWTEGSGVPGWGETAGRFHEFLDALTREVRV